MQSTFEKILKEGERKGYFRLHNDSAKIEYLPSGHKENLNDPEEKVRAEYYFDLIEKYGYPAARMAFEVEMPSRTPQFYADIVIYEDDAQTEPYIVVECKKDGISDAEFEQATKQAIGNARVLHALFTGKPRQHLVYLSVHVSRPCGISGRPLISMTGLSHDEDTFCLYAAPLLVKPRPIE